MARILKYKDNRHKPQSFTLSAGTCLFSLHMFALHQEDAGLDRSWTKVNEDTQGHRNNHGPCLYSHQMATAWLAVSSILGPLVPTFN